MKTVIEYFKELLCWFDLNWVVIPELEIKSSIWNRKLELTFKFWGVIRRRQHAGVAVSKADVLDS